MEVVFQIFVLIMSVVIHEVSHGAMASHLGDPTARLAGRLTLNPTAHLDPVGSFFVPLAVYIATAGTTTFGWAKPVPVNPYNLRAGKWGPSLVSFAGPGANLLIAIIFSVIVRTGQNYFSVGVIGMMASIVIVNIILAVFNLLPFPPLDGSKIVGAFFPHEYRKFEGLVSRYYLIFFALVLIVGWRIVEWPILWLAAHFLGSDVLSVLLIGG